MKEKFREKTSSDEVGDELDYCWEVIFVTQKEEHIVRIPAVQEKMNVM